MKNNNIYISYTHDEDQLVDELRSQLDERGIHLWIDRDISPDEDRSTAIEEAFHQATTYLMLITPDSSKSNWVNIEWGAAASRAASSPEVRIVPVLLKGATWKDVPIRANRVGIDGTNMSLEELAIRISKLVTQ